jgi:uncharacterized phage protein (TIGR01671 family)
MREIKFRAWSYIHKKMCTGGIELNSTDDKGVVSVSLLNENYQMETHFLRNSVDFELEAVLMQYTGLKDKNGVEIYEGDLLNPRGFTPKCKVEFVNGAFVVSTPGFAGRPDLGDIINDLGFHYEVIGNIYENPELLKVGDES